jgi:Caspase domain
MEAAPSISMGPPLVELAAPAVSGSIPATGRRTALCVGINAYPDAPLAGCVADAEVWARCFAGLGFATPAMLTDAQATRSAILGTLSNMIGRSRPGDIVVLQYSGHGTQLDDVDADEDDDSDEAICPYDYASGAFIIDDDFAELFRAIPDGVNVTCFFDCCHSGTNTRLAVGVPPLRPGAARPRFMRATAGMQESHRKFRSGPAQRGLDPRRHPDLMRQVVFAACMDREVAYEQNQQGDFTRNALPILRRGEPMTHEQFQDAVVTAFGPRAAQHPLLDCAAAARSAPLFGARAKGTGVAGRGTSLIEAGGMRSEGIAKLLEVALTMLRSG